MVCAGSFSIFWDIIFISLTTCEGWLAVSTRRKTQQKGVPKRWMWRSHRFYLRQPMGIWTSSCGCKPRERICSSRITTFEAVFISQPVKVICTSSNFTSCNKIQSRKKWKCKKMNKKHHNKNCDQEPTWHFPYLKTGREVGLLNALKKVAFFCVQWSFQKVGWVFWRDLNIPTFLKRYAS